MDTSARQDIAPWRLVALIAGPVVVVAAAWVSADASDSLAIANVALVLAAITVAVAVVDWRAGLTTSLAAALALNYFHTEPLNTFRITQRSDLVSVLLLGSLGVSVSLGTAVRVRAMSRQRLQRTTASEHDELRSGLTGSTSLLDTWTRAVRSVSPELAFVECRTEPVGAGSLPTIARESRDVSLVLPEGGAVVRFRDPARSQQVVLVPRPGIGAVTLDRRAVFAFVDQLEMALGAHW